MNLFFVKNCEKTVFCIFVKKRRLYSTSQFFIKSKKYFEHFFVAAIQLYEKILSMRIDYISNMHTHT